MYVYKHVCVCIYVRICMYVCTYVAAELLDQIRQNILRLLCGTVGGSWARKVEKSGIPPLLHFQGSRLILTDRARIFHIDGKQAEMLCPNI